MEQPELFFHNKELGIGGGVYLGVRAGEYVMGRGRGE